MGGQTAGLGDCEEAVVCTGVALKGVHLLSMGWAVRWLSRFSGSLAHFLPRKPRVLLDKARRIFAVLAGRPDDPSWDMSMKRVASLMTHCRIAGRRDGAFAGDPDVHRRGSFTAMPTGVSFGGGQKVR